MPTADNASNFDFQILKAEFRRSLKKAFTRLLKEEDVDKTYLSSKDYELRNRSNYLQEDIDL